MRLFLLKSESKDLAVCMEGVSKNYDRYLKSATVLHDINLHISRGIMYVIFLINLYNGSPMGRQPKHKKYSQKLSFISDFVELFSLII